MSFVIYALISRTHLPNGLFFYSRYKYLRSFDYFLLVSRTRRLEVLEGNVDQVDGLLGGHKPGSKAEIRI